MDRIRAFAGAAVLMVLVACKGGNEPDDNSHLIRVVIAPPSATLQIGAQVRLTASISGPPGIPQGVRWRSIDPTLATVIDGGPNSGMVTAVSGGSARIRATWVESALTFTEAIVLVTEEPIPAEGRGAKR
jgi:hypothetical protein